MFRYTLTLSHSQSNVGVLSSFSALKSACERLETLR